MPKTVVPMRKPTHFPCPSNATPSATTAHDKSASLRFRECTHPSKLSQFAVYYSGACSRYGSDLSFHLLQGISYWRMSVCLPRNPVYQGAAAICDGQKSYPDIHVQWWLKLTPVKRQFLATHSDAPDKTELFSMRTYGGSQRKQLCCSSKETWTDSGRADRPTASIVSC